MNFIGFVPKIVGPLSFSNLSSSSLQFMSDFEIQDGRVMLKNLTRNFSWKKKNFYRILTKFYIKLTRN